MVSNEHGAYTNVSLTILLPLPSSDIASSERLSEPSTVYFHEFLRPRFWLPPVLSALHPQRPICWTWFVCTVRLEHCTLLCLLWPVQFCQSTQRVHPITPASGPVLIIASLRQWQGAGLKDERCRGHTPISSELCCLSRTRVGAEGWSLKRSSYSFSKFVGFWTRRPPWIRRGVGWRLGRRAEEGTIPVCSFNIRFSSSFFSLLSQLPILPRTAPLHGY